MTKRKKAAPRRPLVSLGLAVRNYREQLQMNLRDFAHAAGVDHTQVLRLEHGMDIRGSALIKLGKRWGFRIPELEKKAGVAK